MEHGSQPCMVRPQLYIASARTEECRPALDQNGITHVLQVGAELVPSHPKHFTYLTLPVYDMPEQDIVSCFPVAFDFIEDAMDRGGGVLIHCQAGISRSATIVIAYCMWKERLSADAATAVVAAARSVIWPNAGFKRQLEEFEGLQWDASRWKGWSMSQYLSKQYGDESVGFMAAMLGGAPQDRVTLRRQMAQQEAGTTERAQAAPRDSSCRKPSACAAASTSAPDTAGDRLRCEVDSCPSSQPGMVDQRLYVRQHPKSPRKPPSTSPVQCSVHDTTGGACGGSCRQAGSPTSTRRMSLACYCGGAGGVYGSPGGSGHRLRRHSTGQHALAAAAGVTAVQMGAMQQLSLSAGSRLAEEAALLMAG